MVAIGRTTSLGSLSGRVAGVRFSGLGRPVAVAIGGESGSFGILTTPPCIEEGFSKVRGRSVGVASQSVYRVPSKLFRDQSLISLSAAQVASC